MVVAVVAALAVPSGAQASLNQWRPLNNWVGITPMAMTSLPGHPDSLYIASALTNFYESSDGGVTWDVSSIPPCQVSKMAVDPTDPSNVYIGCSNFGGMLKSTDSGATWTHDNTGLTYPQYPSDTPTIDAIAIDPSDPSTIYITTAQDELGDDVFVSHDSGDSWTGIHAGIETESVAVSGGRVYVGGGDGQGHGTVATTDDDGATWSTSSSNVDASRTLLADPGNPGTVFAFAWPNSAAGAAWLTTDGGDTWSQLANAPAFIISASAIPGHLFVGTLTGVYETTDAGASWIRSDVDLGGNLQGFAIAADPADPGHVWVAGDRGGLWEVTFDDSLIPGGFPYYQAGTLPASDVTATTAVLHGVAAGVEPGVTGWDQFWWGTSSSYGNSTPQSTLPTTIQTGDDAEVTAALTGLQPNTTYHYHFMATAAWWGTSGIDRPDDVTFTTPPAQAPAVSGEPIVDLRYAPVPGQGLPLVIRWGIAKGTYPTCASTLQISTDGGAFKLLAHTTAAVRSHLTSLQPGHRYAVRVQAADCHGLHSAWATTLFSLRRPGRAPQVAYGQRWTVANGIHSATAIGAAVKLTFTGREVGLVAVTGHDLGSAAVYVDGERAGTIRFSADHPRRLAIVDRVSVSSAGEHTLTLRALTSRGVSIESFGVIHE